MMITVTEAAATKIKDLLLEENNPDVRLRMFVQGGGCSGFSYGFTFDTEVTEDDVKFIENGVELVVDAISLQYINGATVDYKEELMGSRFVVDNPNASHQCGCGSSFAV